MRDPILPPSPYLQRLSEPLAAALSLPTLPHHIHEILFAFILYQTTQSLISPVLSTYLFPTRYPNFNARTRVNWDVHVVSLLQSCLINGLALWVMWNDEERRAMKDSAVERVYGYTGASGLIQGLAAGYFLWDLVVSTRYARIFGLGILAHAVTALMVYSFGFRPFCNYYGPVFILYELSSPFLNIHWFCDKLDLTGSKIQWYNGLLLLGTFFGCRLVWGTYQSARVYMDVWQVLKLDTAALWSEGQNVTRNVFSARDGQLCRGELSCIADQAEVMKFVNRDSQVPLWLIAIYIVSNTTLNVLNFYWFGKMIETVQKRFQGAPHDEFKHEKERRASIIEEAATRLDREVLSGPETPLEEKQNPLLVQAQGVSTGIEGGNEALRRK